MRSRSARSTVCSPPIRATSGLIRPRAGCSSIRCLPIRPGCSAQQMSRSRAGRDAGGKSGAAS
jgi:hypothetical protein